MDQVLNSPELQRLIASGIGAEVRVDKNTNYFYSWLLSWLEKYEGQDLEAVLYRDLPYVFTNNLVASAAAALNPSQRDETKLRWTGIALERASQSPDSEMVDLYKGFVDKLSLLLGDKNPLVVDIGSGTGLTQFYASELPCRFIGLERDPSALLFSERFARRFGLNVQNIMVDFDLALSDRSSLEALQKRIFEHAAGSPIVVISRGGIHPFVSSEKYADMYRFLISDLKSIAGAHYELSGHNTLAFEKIAALLQSRPKVKNSFKGPDPLSYLFDKAAEFGVEIVERIEIYPHIIPQHWPSYISWRARA